MTMQPIWRVAARVRRARACALGGMVALAACGSDPVGGEKPVEEKPVDNTPGLRAAAEKRGLPFGTAADRLFFQGGAAGTQFRQLVAREFNVFTPENDMKHERLQPGRGVYNFDRADTLVAFAEANRMKVRGHTLVWHQQNARWLTSGTWTREEARALLQDHVTRVVSRYRGRLAAWDVVNEAISDNNGAMRSTFWSQNVGPDYIELAFRWAAAADPNVPLFYNDYATEWPGAKSDAMYALLRDLKARGVPVHGVGFQMHMEVGRMPSKQALRANFQRFAELGLKIHITELDVRVRLPATAQSLQTQAENYRDVVEVCTQTPACEMVVVWGVSDADSWVPGTFAGFGDALLFDASFQRKPAYHAVRNLLAGQ